MKKILILGGGFAGVYTAKNLQKLKLRDHEIELVSDNNYFIFHIQFYPIRYILRYN